MGLDEPEGLTPLLSTAQLTQLGWGPDDDARAQWSDADTVTDPRWQDGIDYFASATELCSAHVALQERAQTPAGEPVRSILAGNPGLQSAARSLDYLGVKGGTAPGQLTLTW